MVICSQAFAGDLALLRRLREGNAEAASEVRKQLEAYIEASCSPIGDRRDRMSAISVLLDAMSANQYERLGHYRGNIPLGRFIAIETMDLLLGFILHLAEQDRNRAWRVFESFYLQKVRGWLRRSYGEDYEDIFHELKIALVEDEWFFLKKLEDERRQSTVDSNIMSRLFMKAYRVAMDWFRRKEGRMHIPRALDTTLEKAIFIAIRKKGPDPVTVRSALPDKILAGLSDGEFEEAFGRVLLLVPVKREMVSIDDVNVADNANMSENQLINSMDFRAHIRTLSEAERIRLSRFLTGQKPAEIARSEGVSVEKINEWRRRFIDRAKRKLNPEADATGDFIKDNKDRSPRFGRAGNTGDGV